MRGSFPLRWCVSRVRRGLLLFLLLTAIFLITVSVFVGLGSDSAKELARNVVGKIKRGARGGAGDQRWSRKIRPFVKVDRMMKEAIRNEETKEPFA